jgi:hypothetical protein
MVVHICNPSLLGGGGRRIIVQGWPGQEERREEERGREGTGGEGRGGEEN